MCPKYRIVLSSSNNQMDRSQFYSFLKKFSCSICDRLLTIFPIYTTKNQYGDRVLTICGRCKVPNIEKAVRFTIYENLAKNFQFPCTFYGNGCMEYLAPELMSSHEFTCLYRNITCCFHKQNNCQWLGSFIKLFQHCENRHEDLFLKKHQFKFSPVEDYNSTNILLHCYEIFLLEHSFNRATNQWKFTLIPLGFNQHTQKYCGQINLKTNDTTISKIFPDIRRTPANLDSWKSINVHNMVDEQNSKITGTIKIANSIEELNSMYDTEQNRKLSKLMNCHVCKINIDIFYKCAGGHYVCRTCRDHCCNATVADEPARKIIKLISQKCPYFCGFIGNTSNLKTHEPYCLNKPIDCIFGNQTECLWRNRRMDLLKHILKDHKDSILNLNAVIQLPIDIESKKLQIIKYFHYYDCLFQLRIKLKNSQIDFSIKLDTKSLGNFNNFVFEIIFGLSKNFRMKSNCCLHYQFQKDQFMSFITDKILYFEMYVSKL